VTGRARIRDFLRILTPRGRGLLVAGVVCVLAALTLGESELLRAAALLLALPLVSAAVVSRTKYRLDCDRSLSPTRIPVGGTVTVKLALHNAGRLPTSGLALEDTIPYSLGPRPHVTLPRLGAGGRRTGEYPLRPDVRGRFIVGPLTVRLSDPFGCCEITRAFTTTTELTVVPRLVALPLVPLTGSWSGLGEGGGQTAGALGDDDAAVRDYRQGDDLRKVHWRSTAHAGALMVRREAQPWVARATLLLDDRLAAHRGRGAGSSFEYAVSAAASIADHLGARGFSLRLITGSGHEVRVTSPTLSRVRLLDELAVVTPTRQPNIAPGLGRLGSETERGVVIAITGPLSAAEARTLAGMAGHRAPALALLLDTPSWSRSSAGAPEEMALHRQRAQLDVGGWRTAVARRGTPLEMVWRSLAAGEPVRAAR
jgi:uncharacterized protein (DUF58 family)